MELLRTRWAVPTRFGQFVSSVGLALVILGSSGCLVDRNTANEPLRPLAVERLHPGQSTAAEVVELLGAPVEVVQLGLRSAYRYEFENTKRAALFLIVVALSNQDTRYDRIWVFFDEQDVLSHVAASFEADDTRYAMPWNKVRD